MKPIVEDFTTIAAGLNEVRRANALKCPRAPDKLLRDCLRESTRCPSECRYYDDWTGPITEGEEDG